MKDILKQLFGEAVTDDALKQFNAELGKKFVAKADYNTKLEEIKTLKADKEELEGKITTLSAASGDAEKVKAELETLKETIKKEKEAAKAAAEDQALTDAIVATFGDKKFTSDYVRNGIIADMKTEIAKPENKGKGYDAILEGITKDKEGIFANPNPPAPMPGMGKVETGTTSENAMRAVMGLAPAKTD